MSGDGKGLYASREDEPAARRRQAQATAGPEAWTGPQPLDPAALRRAVAAPRGPTPHEFLALQRTIGNRAVTRLVRARLDVQREEEQREVQAGAGGATPAGATPAGATPGPAAGASLTLPPRYDGDLPFAGTTPQARSLSQIPGASSTATGFEAGHTLPPGLATNNPSPVVTQDGSNFYCGQLQPPDVTFTAITSYYTSAGVHAAPSGARYTYRQGPNAGTTATRVQIRVSDQIQNQIRAGEQEHVDDAVRGFRLSLGRYLAMMRTMAPRAIGPYPTRLECRRRFFDEVGRLSREMVSLSGRLWDQSLARDRPPQRWHALEFDDSTAQPGATPDEVTVAVRPSRTWNVGQVSSSQQIQP